MKYRISEKHRKVVEALADYYDLPSYVYNRAVTYHDTGYPGLVVPVRQELIELSKHDDIERRVAKILKILGCEKDWRCLAA